MQAYILKARDAIQQALNTPDPSMNLVRADAENAFLAAIELLFVDLNYSFTEDQASTIAAKYVALLNSTGLRTQSDITKFAIHNSERLANALQQHPNILDDSRPFSELLR